MLEARTCRRAFLLGYLGESLEGPCGACDVCCRQEEAGAGAGAEPSELGEQLVVDAPVQDELATGVPVRHEAFGDGEVLAVEDDVLTVLFDDVGYKQLDRSTVVEANLLEVTSPPP